MRIRYVLPVAAVATVLLTGALITYLAVATEARQEAEASKIALTALRQARHAALVDYLESLDSQVEVLANSRNLREGLAEIERALGDSEEVRRNRLARVRKLYVGGNMADQQIGRRDRTLAWLEAYVAAHDAKQEWLQLVRRNLQLGDMFLIDRHGNAVYSVLKRADFGTNLFAGPYKDTNLARVGRAALQSASSRSERYGDFAPYAPNNGQPSAFLAHPIVLSGQVVGALVVEMLSSGIVEIMSDTTGLSETGEVFLVGSDRLLRSNLRFREAGGFLQGEVRTESVRRALAGEEGLASYQNDRGETVFSAYQPVYFDGFNWAIVSEISEAEVEDPTEILQDRLVIFAALIMICVACLSFVAANRLAMRLSTLNHAIVAFASDRVSVPGPGDQRADEIGDISRAFVSMRDEIELHIGELSVSRSAIEQNRERLNAMLASSPVGVCVVGAADNLVKFANDRFRDMFKLAESDIGTANQRQLFVDRAACDWVAQTFKNEGRVFDAEVLLMRADGSSFWALLNLMPFDFHGEPARMAWCYDIDEIKQAERKLQVNEARLRLIIDNSVDAIISIDENGIVSDFNKAAERLFEYSADEVIGENVRMLMTKFNRDRHDGYLKRYRETGERRIIGSGREVVAQREDGTTFSAELSVGEAVIDGTRVFTGIVRDISERRLAEREIAEQKRRLDIVLANVPQGVVMYDAERRLTAWNDGFRLATGLPDELLTQGRPFNDLLAYLAAEGVYGQGGSTEELMEERATLLWSGRTERVEFVNTAGLHFDTICAPLEYGGMVVTFTDVTERRKAEAQLRDAYMVISESVEYASRVQRALLPTRQELRLLGEHFVIWEPRDIVGGDIYWIRTLDDRLLLAVGDATGHGVPGAFLTLVATSALNQALLEHPDGDPATLMSAMNRFMKRTLRRKFGEDLAEEGRAMGNDGMELAICVLDPTNDRLDFASGRFSLFHVNGNEITEHRGDRLGIGHIDVPFDAEYTSRTIKLAKDDLICLSSDGLIDQIGGDRRRAFGKTRLRECLSGGGCEPLEQKRQRLWEAFSDYQGEEVRRDDVTVIAFRH